MSSERLENIENLKDPNNLTKKNLPRVDINNLLNRVRQNQKKEKKENLIFLGCVSSVILIIGIIATL